MLKVPNRSRSFYEFWSGILIKTTYWALLLICISFLLYVKPKWKSSVNSTAYRTKTWSLTQDACLITSETFSLKHFSLSNDSNKLQLRLKPD